MAIFNWTEDAATADELPALLDGSSDEGEPVSGVRLDASPGKPDFFVPLIVIDEFPCARRQDVMAVASAVRPLTLETQSRGKLHPHGIFYVAHSRVKNVASVHTYVAKYVAKVSELLAKPSSALRCPHTFPRAATPVGTVSYTHLTLPTNDLV